jgi:hypothetical protein
MNQLLNVLLEELKPFEQGEDIRRLNSKKQGCRTQGSQKIEAYELTFLEAHVTRKMLIDCGALSGPSAAPVNQWVENTLEKREMRPKGPLPLQSDIIRILLEIIMHLCDWAVRTYSRIVIYPSQV